MKSLRIMSFDLDSFVLVKNKEEKSKRVIDYVNNLDVDIALLQGDTNLLYNVLFNNKDSKDYFSEYNYANTMFLNHEKSEWVDDSMRKFASCYVSKLDDSGIALYNIKKYKKESLWEFRNILEEYKNIDHKVVAGTLQNVNIDDFCKKYNLNNVILQNEIFLDYERDIDFVSMTPNTPKIKKHAITLDMFAERNNIKKIDYIKMDVEGAEQKILEGAVNTIKKYRPSLAVAIYHGGELFMEDFFKIPVFIKTIADDYKYYIRSYSPWGGETILFCKPKEK